MTSTLHCTTYDDLLQDVLPHLVNYPQLLPFIGNAWEGQNIKILFVAESHYLPEDSVGKSNSQTWYQGSSQSLSKDECRWTHTRGVVTVADNYCLVQKNFAKGHTIFYNIKAAIFDALQIKNKAQTLFQHFGYYNYFQRPAEESGMSINNSGADNRVAYNTLKALAENTHPTAIIFVSKKAYHTFGYWRKQEMDDIFASLPVHHVPHPASAWWNRKSKTYGNRTGRERFIQIIKDMNLQLN